MSWLKKILPSVVFSEDKKEIPNGVWNNCSLCGAYLYQTELEKNLYVCHKCGNHNRINARTRLEIFLDSNSLNELFSDIESQDVLKFKDTKKYKDRLVQAKKKTGEKDALLVVEGLLYGKPIIVSAFDFSFIGGSMGAAVGEKFVRAIEVAIEKKLPFVCFCCSGGARMQEGLYSLLQMAKTSAAITKIAAAKLPYISVLTDPTTGGVSASLAMLADVIIAEPDALIGFAGPRVIEQTVREVLPEGFQRSEFLYENGAIDMIVPRIKLREQIHGIIDKFMIKNNSQ